METILCIKDEFIKPHLQQSGLILTSNVHNITKQNPLFPEKELWFGPRSSLENDPTYRQIIPYVILHYHDEVVLYRRTTTGKEERLHNKYSIGIGGHANISDAVVTSGTLDVGSTISKATAREIAEEVNCKVAAHCKRWTLGIIYSDSTPVNRVHVGIAILHHLEHDIVTTAEPDVSSCQLIDLSTLRKHYSDMETWSQLCFDTLLQNSNILYDNTKIYEQTQQQLSFIW